MKSNAVKSAAQEVAVFNREQAMALVGLYYSIQKVRIGASNKISAHERQVDTLGDSALIKVLKADLEQVERNAQRGLEAYAKGQPLGRWAMSHYGVGPVIAAGLLAHIDLTRAQSAGSVWRFAGLDPTCRWEKGAKRPFNAALKTLCWKLGESFKKLSGRFPDEFYVRLYLERKKLEVERDKQGLFQEQAHERAKKARAGGYGISPEQKKIWASGHLQPVGLDCRAMRYAVKMFLSHYWAVGRELLLGEAPKPWIIAHGGHIDYIPPPNWPMEEG